MSFWTNVKDELKDKRMTQAELADRLEVNFKTFQGWLTRDFALDIYTAKRIADILNVSVDYLIEGNKDNPGDDEILALYHNIPDHFKQFALNTLSEMQKFQELK